MSFSPLLNELIQALRCLPGVGPKSAQRMAFTLLQRRRESALALAASLQAAMHDIGHCQRCRTFCENALCTLCQDQKRDQHLLCVVESPADILAIEQAGGFRGLYFVLQGHLSPIDGIGPADIGVDVLLKQLQDGCFSEVILATNPTVEGEATAHYLAQQIKSLGIATSRIAHGVPVGGELEFVDSSTLARALAAREHV